jgi:hypothetical protein
MCSTHRRPLSRSPLLVPGLAVSLCFLFPASPAISSPHGIQAQAPVEIVAPHLRAPAGLALDPTTGDLFISEADTGVILRLRLDSPGPPYTVHTHVTGFKRPQGLARDPRDGSLLVVDEKAGTLSRIARNGVITRLRDDLEKPQWVAIGEDGAIYVTAEGGAGFRLRGNEEGVLLKFPADGSPTQLLAKGLKRPEGLRALPDGRVRLVADRWRSEPERDGGTVFEYTPEEPLEILVRSGFKRPHDLSLDALEATYLTADRQKEEGHRDKGVIGKSFSGEGVALFATGLKEPQGLLFDPQGNLYVAEADAGRILKFRAPLAPTLESKPPAFTNEATLTLTGTAERNALLTVRGATVPLPPLADVSAQVRVRASSRRWQPRAGLFTHTLTLTNTGATPLASPLAVVVTSISLSEVTLANATTMVHDQPAVEVPLVEGLLRPSETARVSLNFQGLKHNDRLSYTREIWALRPLAVTNGEGQFSFPVTLTPNTESHLELFATAGLGLGLTSTPTKLAVTHDDTPPEVTITAGPPAVIGVPEATFTFTGQDNLTLPEALQFAWALDFGPFTSFQAASSIMLKGLAEGTHIFRVKAQDKAGNETATPAQRSFTVHTLRVTITQPVDGTTVSPGPLLVKGTVESGGQEVGVTVNGVPAFVQGTGFTVLIPVSPDTTSLTAIATIATGARSTHRIALAVTGTGPPSMSLVVSPQTGAAPLRVVFRLLNLPPESTVSLDADGDGAADFTGPSLDGQAFTYTWPGVYRPTVRVTDSTGTTTVTALVQAYDRVGLDTFLQGKWTTLREALYRGDIEGAVAVVAERSKAVYRDQFSALAAAGALGQVATDLAAISLVQIRDRAAEYDLRTRRNGIEYSFHVLFLVDEDGLWRLWAF